MEQVILVDERDRPIGVAGKLEAHRGTGLLHRAFSVFVFNSAGELLLQRRAAGKYHFAGLWSNTCCGHPRPGETVHDAAERRLGEEFGFHVELRAIDHFVYRATDASSQLSEHELDHVFVGHFDGSPAPDPLEIDEWDWRGLNEVVREVQACPSRFTPWFASALAVIERGDGHSPFSGQA